MLAVNDEVDPIERRGKPLLIGVVPEGVGHHAIRVGDHAVGGDDRKALDGEGFLAFFGPPPLANPDYDATLSDARGPCEQNTKHVSLAPCPRP